MATEHKDTLETVAKPCDDYFSHCNADWIKSNTIPAGYARWSRFNELADATLEQIKSLLGEVSDERVKTIVNHFSNYNYENERKYHNELLYEINSKTNMKELLDLYQSKLSLFGVSFLYCLGVESDLKNSKLNILYLEPNSLPMGREYYLDDEFEEKRKHYVNFVNGLSVLTGGDFSGEKVLELEKKWAELHLKPEDKRNPDNVYFLVEYEKVLEYGVKIDKYYEVVGKGKGKIVCTNLKYFDSYLEGVEFSDLHAYMRYRTMLSFCGYASGDLYYHYFDFFGRVMSGKKEVLPKWKRLINVLDKSVGELLGKEYIDRYFSVESKKNVDEMIRYFKETLKDMLETNKWMEPETKSKALEKLGTINWKIGYPEKFETFEGLDYSDCETLTEVMCKTCEWWFYDEGRELYDEVDRSKWEMLPHQVNAYYHPLLNEIVFPAAILQPPFYSEKFSLAQNYGGIGVVIAHEITHGFDDQGKRFDAEGNLKNWWTEKDEKKFQEEACKLVEQFGSFEIYGSKVNGKLTLGENLADLGGVRISLEALKRKMGDKMSDKDKREFFESFAGIWANLCTEDEGLRLIKMDPHSPGKFRVNGILAHCFDFRELYGVKEGNGMYLGGYKICMIWAL